MTFKLTLTRLPEVKIIEPEMFGDARGFFFESFNARAFAAQVCAGVDFVQDNHSRSLKHVLRGLHYQIRHPQGFAHGFVVISDCAEFLYKTTDYWFPEYGCSILWNDPEIGIEWPLIGAPLLADKDAAGKRLA